VRRVAAGNYERRAAWRNNTDIFGKGNFYLEIQDQGWNRTKIHEALFGWKKS